MPGRGRRFLPLLLRRRGSGRGGLLRSGLLAAFAEPAKTYGGRVYGLDGKGLLSLTPSSRGGEGELTAAADVIGRYVLNCSSRRCNEEIGADCPACTSLRRGKRRRLRRVESASSRRRLRVRVLCDSVNEEGEGG